MKRELQALLDRSRFLRPYGFRVVSVKAGHCTLQLPHRAALERPGGIINGPALMAAADCAMWLAIKAKLGIEGDALTSELNTAFLAPARSEHVYCTARILKFGRRRIYGVAECHGKRASKDIGLGDAVAGRPRLSAGRRPRRSTVKYSRVVGVVTFQREEAEDAPNAAIGLPLSSLAFALPTIQREPRPEASIGSDFPTSDMPGELCQATTHGCQLVRRHWRSGLGHALEERFEA